MKIKIAFIFFLLVSITFLYTGCSSSKYMANNFETGIDTVAEEEIILDSMNLDTFKDSLSNYGEFISIDTSEVDPENSLAEDDTNVDDGIYSNYIWVPNPLNIYEGWTPYTDGRWVWTGYGWTWVSDYSWGWAPYHYGRWWHSESYGWVWSPGRVWGPAWVNWCNNEGYIGWYPISPRVHFGNHGISNVNPHNNNNGWVIVKKKDFTSRISKSTIAAENIKNEFLKTSKPFVSIKKEGKKIVDSGPDIKGIEKTQGKKIEKKSLSEIKGLNIQKKSNNEANEKINKEIINKNTAVKKENTNIVNEPQKNTTETKLKTNVNNVSNYNSTKTYNSTETYNKTNSGSKENSNKTENTNKNINNNKTENKNKTGNTYSPGSTNKTGTSNITGSTSPKVSQTPTKTPVPTVKESPKKQESPSPKKQESPSPKKQESPPQKKQESPPQKKSK